jgi:hypothetical protein
MVVLKELFLGWRSKYEGRLKSSRTGGNAVIIMPSYSGGVT